MTKQEKDLLGLPETATDQEVVKRIGDLRSAEQLLNESGAPSSSAGAKGARIALVSLTGQDRNRGTYVIPPTPRTVALLRAQAFTEKRDYTAPTTPIILDLADVSDADLAEILSDGEVFHVRFDTPCTPTAEVRRFERS